RMGTGQLPGRARHLDPSRLCRGVRLRAQQDRKAPERRRESDHPAAAAAPRPVGRDAPRPPSRLHLAGNLRRQHRQAGRQLPAACLAATVQAMTDTEAQFRQNLAVFERALERARYEAGRALRQYDNIEPENRLVARTLEAALEDKLTAVRTAENQLAAQQARRPVTLTQQEPAWITTAGADLRAIFGAPATTNAQRKELLRAVITEVTVTVPDNGGDDTARTCQVQIIWQG